ncbi:MAG: transcriptional regulator [Clostridiales bacterium GWB2_37_7]|nr:MAG: transcriptional regulator [Clostridiales bacterium GWB2_37_7]
MDLVQVIKVLGDENRLRILNLLKYGELCVCEIERLLDTNQSNTSRHLNKLTLANLICYEKRALYVYYKINNKALEELLFLKELVNNELCKVEKCKADLERLNKYKNSGLSCEDLKEGKGCLKL